MAIIKRQLRRLRSEFGLSRREEEGEASLKGLIFFLVILSFLTLGFYELYGAAGVRRLMRGGRQVYNGSSVTGPGASGSSGSSGGENAVTANPNALKLARQETIDANKAVWSPGKTVISGAKDMGSDIRWKVSPANTGAGGSLKVSVPEPKSSQEKTTTTNAEGDKVEVTKTVWSTTATVTVPYPVLGQRWADLIVSDHKFTITGAAFGGAKHVLPITVSIVKGKEDGEGSSSKGSSKTSSKGSSKTSSKGSSKTSSKGSSGGEGDGLP